MRSIIQIAATITQLPALPERDRRAAIAVILADLYPHLQSWSPWWANRAQDRDHEHTEDAVQHAAIATMKILTDFADGSAHQAVVSWRHYLPIALRNQATAFYELPEVTGVADSVAVHRKLTRARSFALQTMLSTGVVPSDTAVVTDLNAKLNRRRSDARKSGSLITVEELKTSGILLPLRAEAAHA